VAEALDCAHAAGVVHRDIKPENIMLSGHSSFGRAHALVADFGIARAVHEAGETLTQTGLVVGTPAYMSPEQGGALGGTVDGRTDIYSLGCVLYEMLAGERPFAGPTPHAVLARRLIEAPPDVRLARPSVPPGVADAIGRALAVDPEDRYRSAGEFAAALTAGLQDRPTSTSPVRSRAGGVPGAHPRRHVWVAAALLVLSGAAGAAAWILRPPASPAPVDEALLAVAPFNVLEPSLALWHEGLMDVLSRTLDGAGPVHTVSPAVIARRWRGRADHASAVALGRATGAARVLYGAVIPAGADTVRLTATLHDARTERTLAEFDLRGPRDRVFGAALLLLLAGSGAVAAQTTQATRTDSPNVGWNAMTFTKPTDADLKRKLTP
jgi:serine/threonine-protein kinase